MVFLHRGLTGSYAGAVISRAHSTRSSPDKARFTPAAETGMFRDQLIRPVPEQHALLYATRKLLGRCRIEPPVADVNRRVPGSKSPTPRPRYRQSECIWVCVFGSDDRPSPLLPLPQSKCAKVISDDVSLSAICFANPSSSRHPVLRLSVQQARRQPHGVFYFSARPGDFRDRPRAVSSAATCCVRSIRQSKDSILPWRRPFPFSPAHRRSTQDRSWHLGINPRGKNIEKSTGFVRFMLVRSHPDTFVQSFGRTADPECGLKSLLPAPRYAGV